MHNIHSKRMRPLIETSEHYVLKGGYFFDPRSKRMKATKIEVTQARRDVLESDALLVCAYDSGEKFEANHLAGAISLEEFIRQEATISKQRELIFYCA